MPTRSTSHHITSLGHGGVEVAVSASVVSSERLPGAFAEPHAAKVRIVDPRAKQARHGH